MGERYMYPRIQRNLNHHEIQWFYSKQNRPAISSSSQCNDFLSCWEWPSNRVRIYFLTRTFSSFLSPTNTKKQKYTLIYATAKQMNKWVVYLKVKCSYRLSKLNKRATIRTTRSLSYPCYRNTVNQLLFAHILFRVFPWYTDPRRLVFVIKTHPQSCNNSQTSKTGSRWEIFATTRLSHSSQNFLARE